VAPAKPATAPVKPAPAATTAAKPVTPPAKPAPAPAKPAAPAKAETKPVAAAKPTPPPPPKPVAVFKDKALEATVRKQVFTKRDNQEVITAEDVATVSIIEGKGAGITDISGLEKCTALASLTLTDNKVSNLAALKGLERLQFLDVANNQISDISPLAWRPLTTKGDQTLANGFTIVCTLYSWIPFYSASQCCIVCITEPKMMDTRLSRNSFIF
jgi:Leucine-rich repeat (LRR) protein